jgi:hypothetical protein
VRQSILRGIEQGSRAEIIYNRDPCLVSQCSKILQFGLFRKTYDLEIAAMCTQHQRGGLFQRFLVIG